MPLVLQVLKTSMQLQLGNIVLKGDANDNLLRAGKGDDEIWLGAGADTAVAQNSDSGGDTLLLI